MQTKSSWNRLHIPLLAGVLAVIGLAADDPKKAPPIPAGGDSAEVIKALDEAWPDHPEWVDMLTSILQDDNMTANYGWFRTAVAQSRFDWASSKKRYDRDGNGQIERAEFPGSDADFAGSTMTATRP